MNQEVIITTKYKGLVRDKAICSGKLDSFNLNTGEAEVTFSINRRKYDVTFTVKLQNARYKSN